MYFTENSTTRQVGQSKATVLAYSCHERGDAPIITWELMYPRYIHSELMTHRMFSRNAASSRATPTHVLANQVACDPVFFDSLTTNKSGMIGGEPLSPEDAESFEIEWRGLASEVAKCAMAWKERYNLSKQIINRILEPFLPIRTIVTATDTDNFFKLRLAPDAQPEIKSLARAMKESMEAATPKKLEEFEYHIPYGELLQEGCETTEDLIIRAVAACARVSVMRGDGKKTTLEEDTKFVARLLKSGHMSPFEHVAQCEGYYMDDGYESNGMFANFYLWTSMRYQAENPPWCPGADKFVERLKEAAGD